MLLKSDRASTGHPADLGVTTREVKRERKKEREGRWVGREGGREESRKARLVRCVFMVVLASIHWSASTLV